MAAKTKSPKNPNLDVIEPLATEGSEAEEKVISVRIPSRSKSTEAKVETPKDDSPIAESTKEDPQPVESKENSTAKVSSFSQLDEPQNVAAKEPLEDHSSENEVAVSPASPNDESSKLNEEPVGENETQNVQEKEDEMKEWLNDTQDDELELLGESGPKQSKLKVLVIALFVVLLLGVIGGGVYYYQQNATVSEEPDQALNEPQTVLPTATPAISEAPQEDIDVSEYSVEVLNGTTVAGLAGTTADLFTDAGFAEATAGNADSSSYEETEVTLKEGVPSGLFDAIKAVLEADYEVVLSDETLDEDSEYDAQIIVGSNPAPVEVDEDPTPTPEE